MTTTRVRAERIDTTTGVRWFLHEGCWAQITDPDPRLDDVLTRADGWTSDPRLRSRLAHEDAARLDEMLDLFQRTGLAVSGRPESAVAAVHVALIGVGPLARRVADGLVRSGVRRLTVLDPAPVTTESADEVPGRRGRALVDSLRPRHNVDLLAVNDVRRLASDGVDLALVVTGTIEPDRVLLDELVRLDLPHLVVRTHRDTAHIGPLVLPGSTACVGCHDLGRSRLDPHWPQVLVRLQSMPARPHPVMASQVAARTVLEVGWLARDLAHGGRLTGHVEVHDLTTPEVRGIGFGASADCPCGAHG